ncbi:MAG: thiol-disulfide oxidoreductase DCC family protein [Bacteroidetes bacterium]|nr:thiol-disulfide oxidoreductase DCC family protein [Bacteroidota bacterium]
MPTNLVLFDGVCNLCNHSVQLLLKIDSKKKLVFGSLQSEKAKSLLTDHGIDPNQMNSIVFLKEEKAYTESDAVLHICKTIGGVWQIAYLFILIPRFIRDALYRFIARHRYRWFGKRESCMLPSPELKNRFID